MKLIIKIMLFISVYLPACNCLMASDGEFPYSQELEKMVAEWESFELRKNWPDINTAEEYEFFISQNQDMGLSPLGWYVIRVANTSDQAPSSSKKLQVYLHHGYHGKEYPMEKIEDYKASRILHTIDINEFFRLPKFPAQHARIAYPHLGGAIYVLGRQKKDDSVIEIFRILGMSAPLDNIHQMLRELTLSKELVKMERVEKALRVLQAESEPKQSLRDLLIEVKPHGVRSGFLPWPSE